MTSTARRNSKFKIQNDARGLALSEAMPKALRCANKIQAGIQHKVFRDFELYAYFRRVVLTILFRGLEKMDEIEKLLAELQTEYKQAKPTQQQPQQNIAKPSIPASAKSLSLIDSLLDEVKADFNERDQVEELRRKQELEQEKIRQAQLQAKELEVLKNHAKEWLDKLDPFSSEGLWFERFAEGYPSKLAAAMEYLRNNQ